MKETFLFVIAAFAADVAIDHETRAISGGAKFSPVRYIANWKKGELTAAFR